MAHLWRIAKRLVRCPPPGCWSSAIPRALPSVTCPELRATSVLHSLGCAGRWSASTVQLKFGPSRIPPMAELESNERCGGGERPPAGEPRAAPTIVNSASPPDHDPEDHFAARRRGATSNRITAAIAPITEGPHPNAIDRSLVHRASRSRVAGVTRALPAPGRLGQCVELTPPKSRRGSGTQIR
jgi:hypothetical protein